MYIQPKKKYLKEFHIKFSACLKRILQLSNAVFDIMVHLLAHFIRKIKLCELVYLKWIYLVECYMKIISKLDWRQPF